MKDIPQYCQNCRAANRLGERTCCECGTRLMLVVFPPAIRHDESLVPSFYEDHLLERITLLEIRLVQVAERLASALDLMFKQTKSAQAQRLLLEALIDSLNMLGAVEKDRLTQNWRQKIEADGERETAGQRHERIFKEILSHHKGAPAEPFAHLIKEGIKLLSLNEEKQAVRTFENASLLSPENVPLHIFIAENLFRADKLELAGSYLEKAQGHAPQNEKILLLLGVIAANDGDAEKSRALLNQIPRRRATKFCVNLIVGILAAVEGDWAQALAAFREALTAHDSAETQYLVGCAYFQVGRQKIAVRHLQKAVEADPNFADAWFMLGFVYENLGDAARKNQAIELAWSAKDAGAQAVEYLKRKNQKMPETALPFLRLPHFKNRLLANLPPRVRKILREEIYKIIN